MRRLLLYLGSSIAPIVYVTFFSEEYRCFGSLSQCGISTASCNSLLAGDHANVTPISKGPPSSRVVNYGIGATLSKVFERLVSVRLGQFMKRGGVLRTTKFAYRKGLHLCDTLLCVSHT